MGSSSSSTSSPTSKAAAPRDFGEVKDLGIAILGILQ
jgi:hypothetical protein